MINDLKIVFVAVSTLGLCLASTLCPSPAGAACVTTQCHSDMQNSDDLHAADIDCERCHKSVEAAHPLEGRKTFRLVEGDGCLSCHSAVVDHEFVHPPAVGGDCGVCHQLHGNKTAQLLRASEIDLCFTCHDGVFNRDLPLLHGSISEGVCSSCHNPHGTAYEKLLIQEYPTALFVSYSDDEYQLCFSCHQRDLLLFADTSFATGFRDGDLNLHFLHVNRASRGKNCKLCHETHAGRLPVLMAEKVPFGKWQLPLNFQKTDTGGSCMPGCHRQYSYDRKNPVKKLIIEQ